MENLLISPTLKSPRVNFNPVNGLFEITGVSLLENTLEYYRPILDWLTLYLDNSLATTTFIFKLSYCNTSSLQFIYDMINCLSSIHKINTELKIIWYYASDDVDMKELGQDIESSFDFKFTFVEINVEE